MLDYKEMYATLFNSMTHAIAIMQEAQKQTEEMYIASNPPDLKLLNFVTPEDEALKEESAKAT